MLFCISECGCGDGDSGCTKCFICKMCAFEENPEQELDDDNDVDDLIKINLFGAFYGIYSFTFYVLIIYWIFHYK